MSEELLTDHELAAGVVPNIPAARYVPPSPERSRYHWIRRYQGGPAIPLYWCAAWHKNGGQGWGRWAEPDREHRWEYCGPCPSPNDVVSYSRAEWICHDPGQPVCRVCGLGMRGGDGA